MQRRKVVAVSERIYNSNNINIKLLYFYFTNAWLVALNIYKY